MTLKQMLENYAPSNVQTKCPSCLRDLEVIYSNNSNSSPVKFLQMLCIYLESDLFIKEIRNLEIKYLVSENKDSLYLVLTFDEQLHMLLIRHK